MQAIGDLVMAYILARVIGHYGVENLVAGAFVGVMMWLGLSPRAGRIGGLRETSDELRLRQGGFNLVSIAVMGAIIGVLM